MQPKTRILWERVTSDPSLFFLSYDGKFLFDRTLLFEFDRTLLSTGQGTSFGHHRTILSTRQDASPRIQQGASFDRLFGSAHDSRTYRISRTAQTKLEEIHIIASPRDHLEIKKVYSGSATTAATALTATISTASTFAATGSPATTTAIICSAADLCSTATAIVYSAADLCPTATSYHYQKYIYRFSTLIYYITPQFQPIPHPPPPSRQNMAIFLSLPHSTIAHGKGQPSASSKKSMPMRSYPAKKTKRNLSTLITKITRSDLQRPPTLSPSHALRM